MSWFGLLIGIFRWLAAWVLGEKQVGEIMWWLGLLYIHSKPMCVCAIYDYIYIYTHEYSFFFVHVSLIISILYWIFMIYIYIYIYILQRKYLLLLTFFLVVSRSLRTISITFGIAGGPKLALVEGGRWWVVGGGLCRSISTMKPIAPEVSLGRLKGQLWKFDYFWNWWKHW